MIDSLSLNLFINHKVGRRSILFVLLISLIFIFFFSIVSGLLLAFSFASGILAINVFLGSKTFDSLTVSHESNCANHLIVNLNTGCGVCGDNQCKRQKSVKDNQPWLGLNIPKDVDQAIQDLYNKILNEFVIPWHSKFSKDESFVFELRRCLAYASSILLKRLLQVDVGEVIIDQLIPIGLRHVSNYLQIVKISAEENISVEAASVKYLNKRLHPAVRSRKSELQYLRCLSELLSNYLVQGSQLKCLSFRALIRELLGGWVFLPLADTLCDPYYINTIFLLVLSPEPLTQFPDNSGLQVQFLHKFVFQNKDFSAKKSVLQANLSAILKDQKLLYTFMQFLKREGVVHLLQFCLDVEEFSKKILNPDLTQSEMENLYKEAWDLFSVYFKPESPDSIHFPKHIVQQMEQVLASLVLDCGAPSISKMRTNPTMFKAYDIAYSSLEETYCPLFYLSDEYFIQLCGERKTLKVPKGFSSPSQPGSPVKTRSKKNSEVGVVGKLSNKFNRLLQFQAVEGRALFDDGQLDLAEGECAEDLQMETCPDSTHRDMSLWHVTVPYVITKQDSNSKPYPVFNILVAEIGTKENKNSKAKWNVERRFNDFYILQSKLAEFHGDFEDGTQLPPKSGVFSPRGNEFLESRRQLFEEYLQKLLQKPSLRGSDLLYFFLHSPAEFSSCLSAQDGIGKIIKRSVEPIKLRKERGQKLENFLTVFLSSTEGVKKSGKYEWQDINQEPIRKKRSITQSIYKNNFDDFINKTETTKVGEYVQEESPVLYGPWDCIIYVISNLMGASSRVVQTTISLKCILGQSSDSFIRQLTTRKLKSVLVSGRVSHLIRLLQDALLSSGRNPKKQTDKNVKAKVVLRVRNLTNNFLIRWFLPQCNDGIDKIVDCLQFPLLNKHLFYCLLDEVVRVLFPELATSS